MTNNLMNNAENLIFINESSLSVSSSSSTSSTSSSLSDSYLISSYEAANLKVNNLKFVDAKTANNQGFQPKELINQAAYSTMQQHGYEYATATFDQNDFKHEYSTHAFTNQASLVDYYNCKSKFYDYYCLLNKHRGGMGCLLIFFSPPYWIILI